MPQRHLLTDHPIAIYEAEKQGLMPVPSALRKDGFWSTFSLFCNSMMNPATLISSGLMILAGLPLWLTIFLQVLGSSFSMWPFVVVARIGSRYGIPGQVFCRAVFGYQGSRWLTSLLRGLTSVYWYAIQTLAAMMAVDAMLTNFGITVPLGWLSVGFVILQGGVAVIGYGGMSFLSKFTLPLKIAIFALLLLWLVDNGGAQALPESVFRFQLTQDSWGWPLALLWLNGLACGMMSLVTDAADFSRYTRLSARMGFGAVCGVACGTGIGALFGGWCVIAGGAQSINPFETLIQLQPGILILILILVVSVLDAWTINVINLYTGGFSLANAFPKLGRQKATLLVIAAATVLAMFPEIIHRYVEILSATGVIYASISGVLLGWYWRHGRKLDISALYEEQGRYWYWKGWNPAAICSFITMVVLTHFLSPVWLPSIQALLGAAILLLLLDRLFFKKVGRHRVPH